MVSENSVGKLYLVAIPIGNPTDLTMRAESILHEVDQIVAEEAKPARQFLKSLNIPFDRLLLLNEHSGQEDRDELLDLLINGNSVALISDTGTPVWADPGYELVKQAISSEVDIVPIPGPASINAALVAAGFPMARFVYRGFLPRAREKRDAAIKELSSEKYPVVLMEAPYRLQQLLTSLQEQLDPNKRIALCWQLTMDDEQIVRGTSSEVLQVAQQRGWKKGEFVIVIEGLRSK